MREIVQKAVHSEIHEHGKPARVDEMMRETVHPGRKAGKKKKKKQGHMHFFMCFAVAVLVLIGMNSIILLVLVLKEMFK
jgi:cytoskeletal protein RodZ